MSDPITPERPTGQDLARRAQETAGYWDDTVRELERERNEARAERDEARARNGAARTYTEALEKDRRKDAAKADRLTEQISAVRQVVAWLRGADDEMTQIADRIDRALDGQEADHA